MRDWLYVGDFCRAVWLAFTKGVGGEIYNAGAGNHISNLDLTNKLVKILEGDPDLIKQVADRPGHDFCYAVNWQKIKKLGWQPEDDFETKLAETVTWYRDNPDWAATILGKSPGDQADGAFFENHYRNRT
jgi:dTDP-glucose 4,6-dehydratase